MGNNSVRPNITKDDILAEIKLTIDADFMNKGVFLVVEGIDDIAFFKGKLIETVTLFESFSGKQGVFDIVNHFSDKRIIGVCDRDYDKVDAGNRVFYYDFNCLEIMLIHNDLVFQSISNVHYNGDMDFKSLRSSILADLKIISLTRKMNSTNSWGLVLSGVSYCKTYSSALKRFEPEKLINELIKLNPCLNNTKYDILQTIRSLQNFNFSEEEYYLLTQGHDFLYCFQTQCLNETAKKRKCVNAEIILACLLSAYNIFEFRKTALYSNLSSYAMEHTLEIIA